MEQDGHFLSGGDGSLHGISMSIFTEMSSTEGEGAPQTCVLQSSCNPSGCGHTKPPQQKYFPFLIISIVIDYLSYIGKTILHDHF